jgi:hypothetical protein
MNMDPDPRLTRRDAERLLAGRGGPDERLSELLAAATAPADGALPGEAAVLAQFRASRPEPARPRRRAVLLKAAFANLLAAKIGLGIAVAAAATGGIALAGATGSLPDAVQNFAHSALGAPAAHTGHGAGRPSMLPSVGTPSQPARPSESGSPPAPSGSPSPSLTGLCHAFEAGATTNPGKALDNPAFSALVAAAGGKDSVVAFCTTLVGSLPTQHDSHPGGRPTDAPRTHPTGARTTHPTGAPRTHPTGAPTTHPTGASPTHPTGAATGARTARGTTPRVHPGPP